MHASQFSIPLGESEGKTLFSFHDPKSAGLELGEG